MSNKAARERLHSYVVRVYRHTRNDIAGQVEDVESGLMRPFRSPGELWTAIGGTVRASRERRR